MTAIKPGVEAFVDGRCGCQFALNPLRVRVAKLLDHRTYGPELVWVQVYQINHGGEAFRSRELLVIRSAFEAACRRGVSRVPRSGKEVSSRAPAV